MTFLYALLGSVSAFAQVEIGAEVSCPDSVFIFEDGGASQDSTYVAGSPGIVFPILSLHLNNDTLFPGERYAVVTPFNRFLQPEEEYYDPNIPIHTYFDFMQPEPQVNAPGYIAAFNLTAGDSIHLLLDMDYYDQDSIVLVGSPWSEFVPCHPYGLFIWFQGTVDQYGTIFSDADTSNDLAVVPVIYDCFAGSGTGMLSLYHQNVTLQAFPNPASSQLSLQQYFERNAKVSLRITDMSGRVVLHKELGKLQGDQQIEVDIASLPPGTYLLELSSIYLKGTCRFVKE